MGINFYAVIVAAIVPMALGFVWYGPLFGKAWMREAGISTETIQKSNMMVIFGLSLLFSLLFAFNVNFIVNHEMHVHSLFMDKQGQIDPNGPDGILLKQVMDSVGMRYRYWQHGALHGAIAGVFFVLPIIAVNGLFERKSWKYIFINAGFWTISLVLMGAIICSWVK